MFNDNVLKAAQAAKARIAIVSRGKDNAERISIKTIPTRDGDALVLRVPGYFATVAELPMRPQDKTPTFGASLTDLAFKDAELGTVTLVTGKRGFVGFRLS